MKRKILFSIVLILFTTACGAKNKTNTSNNNTQNTTDPTFNTPYIGDITVGDITFNMLSTANEIKETGMKQNIDINQYTDRNTDSNMFYEFTDFDNRYEVVFETHNSIYQELGCDGCDYAMSTFVKLPKNITYNSTTNDVIKAYGKPLTNELIHDGSYWYEDNNLTGENFEGIECTMLEYKVTNSDINKFRLILYFDKATNKLYKIKYTAEFEK